MVRTVVENFAPIYKADLGFSSRIPMYYTYECEGPNVSQLTNLMRDRKTTMMFLMNLTFLREFGKNTILTSKMAFEHGLSIEIDRSFHCHYCYIIKKHLRP